MDDIQGDIEKIRQVLQTEETALNFVEDGTDNPPPESDLSGSSRQANQLFSLGSEEDEGDDFPATPAMGLALNRAYQELIEENLKRIKLVLTHNRERQLQIEEEISETSQIEGSRRRRLGPNIFAVPYFKDVTGLCPPPNGDTILKKLNQEIDPNIKSSRPWIPAETKCLQEAVMEDCRQKLIGPLLAKRELACEKLLQVATDDELPELRDEKQRLEAQIGDIRRKSLPDLLSDVAEVFGEHRIVENIDWMKISTINFDGQRSVEELARSWVHFVHPKVNTTKFKSDEDAQLLKAAQKHGLMNWRLIAEDLGSNRTAFQCLQRYQMKLNPCLKTGKWSTEEDDILREVVEQCRQPNGDIDWGNVSFFMEGRSYDHCQSRWREILRDGTKRRGKWTDEEDMKLLMAVKMFGMQWTKVTKFVPGRNNLQVRERWHTAFQNMKKGEWTYAEDRAIWLHVQKHGRAKWAQLARSLKQRTDNSVLLRYKRLHKWSSVYNGDKRKNQSLAGFVHLNAKHLRLELGFRGPEGRRKQREQTQTFNDSTLMWKEAVRQGAVPKEVTGRELVVGCAVGEEELLQQHEVKARASSHKRKARRKQMDEGEGRTAEDCLIAEDIRNGVLIPRPPPEVENTRIGHRVFNQRLALQQKLHDQVERSLVRQTRGKGVRVNKGALEQQVTDILGGQNTGDLSALDRLRLDAMGKMLTVKEILDLSTSIQRKVSKSDRILKKTKGPGRPSNRQDVNHSEVDEKIWSLVSESGMMEPLLDSHARTDVRSSDELKSRVSKLMSAALNVNLSESVQQGIRLCGGEKPAPWRPGQASATQMNSLRSSLSHLSQITGSVFPPLPRHLHTADTQEEAPAPHTHTPTDSQAAIYNIPPLPPNTLTIQAFRSILIHRKKLTDIAGKFHIPGTLTLGKNQGAKAENSEDILAYKIMKREQTQNDKLQRRDETQDQHRFQGYVARNTQQELMLGDSVLLLPSPLVTSQSNPTTLSQPSLQPCSSQNHGNVIQLPQNHGNVTEQPQNHGNVTEQLQSHSNVTQRATFTEPPQLQFPPSHLTPNLIPPAQSLHPPTHPAPPTHNASLEDVVEPIEGFSQPSERGVRILPQHIDQSAHGDHLGRFSTEDLLLAKRVVQEQEVSALRRGHMTSDSMARHMMAAHEGAGASPEDTEAPAEKGDKSSRPRALASLRDHHDYSLLNARFKSLFLWPALLSTVNIKKPLPSLRTRWSHKPGPPSPESSLPPRSIFGSAAAGRDGETEQGEEMEGGVMDGQMEVPADPSTAEHVPGQYILNKVIAQRRKWDSAPSDKERQAYRRRERVVADPSSEASNSDRKKYGQRKRERVDTEPFPGKQTVLKRAKRRRDWQGRLTLSGEQKEEVRRILQEVRAEEAVTGETVTGETEEEVLCRAEHLVASLQKRVASLQKRMATRQHPDNQRVGNHVTDSRSSREEDNLLDDYLPCIMIDGRLFPLTHPLFAAFVGGVTGGGDRE